MYHLFIYFIYAIIENKAHSYNENWLYLSLKNIEKLPYRILKTEH